MRCLTDLLPHQVPAVEKLLPLRVGALFMDMGLGKTRTAIELIARRVEKVSRVIWFCPVSLRDTIEAELFKHVARDDSHGQVFVFDEKVKPGSIPSAFWYVVGLESMGSSARVILAVKELIDDKTAVIVDESSYIKGHDSKRTWWVTELANVARYRLLLNGTPISQGVVDLYAQFRFLSPLILGYRSFYSFAANHLEYSEKYPGMIVRSLNVNVLTAKIAPYTYQVKKEECLDLPGKLYQSHYFSMTAAQESAYQRAKRELLADLELENYMDSQAAIFRLFTALQQITSGFWNRREPSDTRRNKNPLELHCYDHKRDDALLAVLDRIPNHEPVIVWAKFGHDLQTIQAAAEKRFGPGCCSLFYGGNASKRGDELARWKSGGSRFLVATPSSGGHGLTLNEAGFVVFYSNGFKYSERIQAEDRCYRIGQTRAVTYIDLICRDSIDERIRSALSSKANIVTAFRHEVERLKRSGNLAKIQAMVKDL